MMPDPSETQNDPRGFRALPREARFILPVRVCNGQRGRLVQIFRLSQAIKAERRIALIEAAVAHECAETLPRIELLLVFRNDDR